MKRMMNVFSFVAITLVMVLGLVACSTDFESPTGSADPELAGNYYSVGGIMEEVGIRVHEGEIDLNLPAGIWKITYTVDGLPYEVAVYLESEQLVFIGIRDSALATDVIIQEGTSARDDLISGELFDVADWVPVQAMAPIPLVANGDIVKGEDDKNLFPELDEEVVHPKPELVVVAAAPAAPVAKATLKSYSWNGKELILVSEEAIAGTTCSVKITNNHTTCWGAEFTVDGVLRHLHEVPRNNSDYTWEGLDCPAPAPQHTPF